MASIRNIKKFVIFQTNELLDDCRLTLWFNPSIEQEMIVDIMLKAVDLRTELFDMINNPAEKDNRKLLKKHYQQVNTKLYVELDKLFEELSAIFKNI